MRGAPPLRFVGLVLGGWVCARAMMLAPEWFEREEAAEPPLPRPNAIVPAPAASRLASISPAVERAVRHDAIMERNIVRAMPAGATPVRPEQFAAIQFLPPTQRLIPHAPLAQSYSRRASAAAPIASAALRASSVSRLSASAWAFFRRGEGEPLAAGAGLLGGSQAGARLSYRLNNDPARPLALAGRFYSPLRNRKGSEAAIGIEWRPLRSIPITFLAERRQKIGKEGRSAFGLMAYGGIDEQPLVGPLKLDAYAQAGIVGVRRRDAFVDGSLAVGLPIDAVPLKLGAAAWGAVQPGVVRVDVGPQISYRLPVQGQSMRLTAEWRFHIGGDAEPGSGPALTLSTAF